MRIFSLLPQISRWDDKVDAFARAFAVKLADFLPRMVGAVLILLVFWGLHRLARRILKRTFSTGRVDLLAADILAKLIKYTILGLGVLMAASQLGFDIVSMLAGLGVAGLAIGFAARDSLSNFISGLILLWDRPFALGDDVEIAGVEGLVRHIELRATKLETLDGNDVIIPNSDVVSKHIVNFTRSPRVRLRVTVPIAHGSNVEAARAALLRLTDGDRRVLGDPPPAVALTEMAGPSLLLELSFWIDQPRQRYAVRAEYLEKAKRALEAAAIPFPAGPSEILLRETRRD